MPQPKHILPFVSLIISVYSVDLTEVTPTLTTFGPLSAFTPPANCFSRSLWRTSRFYDNANPASTFQSRFFTRWYVGCNIDEDTGEYNTCCPPNYNTWGFYAPGKCPGGYTTLTTAAANPWIGDVRGMVCCPDIKSPAGTTFGGANFATSFVNPLDRDPISISCFQWDEDTTTSGTVFQANYIARAIIVFEKEVTGAFQFAAAVGDPTRPPPTSTAKSTSKSLPTSENTNATPSPGSTTSAPEETSSTPQETSSTPVTSTSSNSPASTSPSNQTNGDKKDLSGGAIAGIAIGVAIPVIAGIAFVAYKFGRRRKDVPVVPLHNDPFAKEQGFGGIGNGQGNGWR